MGRIFNIMGKSGSGKDSIFKALLRDHSLALRPVVTYTTRPMRRGETEGVEYHFVTEKQLDALGQQGKIIERRRYETVRGTWYYCTVDDGQFDAGHHYLMIATLPAYVALKTYFGAQQVVPLYLSVDDGVRLQRALTRERRQKPPDYAELCRRYLADCADFSPENLRQADVRHSYENVRFSTCVAQIKREIRRNLA